MFKINTVKNFLGTTKFGGTASEGSTKTCPERAVNVLCCQEKTKILFGITAQQKKMDW